MALLDDPQYFNAKFFLSQWKAYDSVAQIEEYVKRLTTHPYFGTHVCLLAVPLTILKELSDKITHPRVVLGANKMHSAKSGSFTASVSGELLKKNRARFVLIGSAKSREISSNRDLSFHDQIKAALESDVTPFYFIGETFAEQQEHKSESILSKQVQEGLGDLTLQELTKLCIVNESPWLQTTPENLTTDRLIQHHQLFLKVLSENLGEEILPSLKLIDALPLDFESVKQLLEIARSKGLYASNPEAFFSIMNEVHAEALKLEEIPYKPTFIEESKSPVTEEVKSTVENAEENKLLQRERSTPATSIEKSELLENVNVENEISDEIAFENDKEFAVGEQEEESFLEETLKRTKKTEHSDKSIEKIAVNVEENLAHELAADDQAEAPSPFTPSPLQREAILENEIQPWEEAADATPNTSTADSSVDSTFSASPTSNADLIPEEEVFSDSTLKENYPMSILETPPEDNSEDSQELKELQIKLQHMKSLDKSLAECYAQINERMDSLPALREVFPERLNKMTADLSKLDPELQEQINRGNLSFFTENPEKMQAAAGVLVQIQEINQLLQKTAAIPRELDRILSKSREIRKALEAEWGYFQVSRQRIKESFPGFPFPAAPSQLLIPEPKTDIKPMDFGPSGLVNKRVAVVKTPPMPK